jgi:hypothetical protein
MIRCTVAFGVAYIYELAVSVENDTNNNKTNKQWDYLTF